VLEERFPAIPKHSDVTTLASLPRVEVVTAGFPCQDLSQAGRTRGIGGSQSRLVQHVFRLLDGDAEPEWLLLENVPFMLRLERGEAMRYLTSELEGRGFRWAYRVVDSRSFGLPQRRQRVILLASRTSDPRPVLFSQDAGPRPDPDPESCACGFYWTEGLRGLGWAVDAVPTLKGGSGLGIPSPPAIWTSAGTFVTPDIRDAERLQGFEADWTLPSAPEGHRSGPRWKLLGNAVSVPVAAWVAEHLLSNDFDDEWFDRNQPLHETATWPVAAWGATGERGRVEVSAFPEAREREPLEDFLLHDTIPLSERAAAGFIERADRSTLNFPDGLLDGLRSHLEDVRGCIPA
jgi:DNA (cytosine-5)-methyltransferase 1